MPVSFVSSPLVAHSPCKSQRFLCTPRRLRSTSTVHPKRRVCQVHLTMSSAAPRRGVLMLCTGNICRSPAAEAVMKGVLEKRNLGTQFFVDSCGTGGGSSNWYKKNGFSYHEGDLADPRMRAAASQRGLKLESRSRPLRKDDFDKFEVIVAMDSHNLRAIETAREYWKVENPRARIVLMSEFSPDDSFRGQPVPDPYWSGADGFEYALDLIEGACEGLADNLVSSSAQAASQ